MTCGSPAGLSSPSLIGKEKQIGQAHEPHAPVPHGDASGESELVVKDGALARLAVGAEILENQDPVLRLAGAHGIVRVFNHPQPPAVVDGVSKPAARCPARPSRVARGNPAAASFSLAPPLGGTALRGGDRALGIFEGLMLGSGERGRGGGGEGARFHRRGISEEHPTANTQHPTSSAQARSRAWSVGYEF